MAVDYPGKVEWVHMKVVSECKNILMKARDQATRCLCYAKGVGEANNPVCIFHHIPKCGGTSIRYALKNWFSILNDSRYGYGEDILSPIKLKKLPPRCCVCGHFEVPGQGLFDRYPECMEGKQYPVFTFLRDPFEIKVSLFHYEQKRGLSVPDIETHMFDRKNYLADMLGIRTKDDISVILDRYIFVGLVEQVQLSFDLLAKILGRGSVQVPVKNVTPRDVGTIKDYCFDKFVQENALDYAIYQYAQQRLSEENS